MSRIDNATLVVTTKAGSVAYNDSANISADDVTLANIAGNLTNLLVYSESFNVLRVMSGILSNLCRTASCHSVPRAYASVGKQFNLPVALSSADITC